MKPTLNAYELDALYKPGDTDLLDTPFCRAIPLVMRQNMTAARFIEVATRAPIPPFIKRAGLAGAHAWQLDIVLKPYRVHVALFESDLLAQASTFDAALDLIDALRDDLAEVPAMRTAVFRAIVGAVPGLSDDQRAELVAYARAAGM